MTLVCCFAFLTELAGQCPQRKHFGSDPACGDRNGGVAAAVHEGSFSSGFPSIEMVAQGFFGIMQARFDSANGGLRDGGDVLEREILQEMQGDDGSMVWRQGFEGCVERLRRLLMNEPRVRGRDVIDPFLQGFSIDRFFAFWLAPQPRAFLVGDAEKPGPEFRIFGKRVDVFGRVDEGFLDNIQRGLFLTDEFEDESVEGKLVAAEELVPSLRIKGPGFRDRQLFRWRHGEHLH